MRFDVVIAGTGPAGGAAACALAESGARVLLLDRARLPRIKPCGGGLSPAVEQQIGWDIGHLVEARVRASRWLLDHERMREVNGGEDMLMINRRDFDVHLVERALRLGGGRVELRDGCAVEGVVEDADGVTVHAAGGERIRAGYVIAADGALGATAKSAGLARPTRPGLAIDAEVEVDPEVFEAERRFTTFNFACIRFGYGWVFPKAGYLSCGVGTLSGRVRLPAALDDYLARTLPPGSVRSQQRRGHPVPLWAGHVPVATARVCAVGDAASLVDPIMGEGICFAMHSGRAAAAVILALLGHDAARPGDRPADCRAYGREIETGIGAEFERLRRFVLPLFLKRPDFFFRQFYQEGRSYFSLARALDARLASAPPPAA